MRGAHNSAASRLLGKVIAGRYRLSELLGEGGMGEVYRAEDPDGRALAVKILHYALLGSEATPRFLREAALMRRIESQHVVPTLDAGHDPAHDALFIVMPLLEGTDVAELLNRLGALHPLPAIRIALQAAKGLAAAHALGAVHRDVKPANLFLATAENGDVYVRVCDFGVAKLSFDADNVDLTVTGSRIGSPLYMSPEQLRSSKHVDQRSDVWSLGTTLYEMLSGRAPFAQGESVAAIVMSVSTRDAPPLRSVAPWVAPGIARVVHRAIERDADRRFQTMQQFAAALHEFAAGEDQLTECMLMAVPNEMRREALSDSDLEIGLRTILSPTDPAPEADRVIGQLLAGRYRVVGMLGRGGMGAVYEVIAPDGRHHAAKLILREARGSDKNALKRFVREARAAVDIDSPYVARTFEAGADSALNVPFIIMELMSGTDLGTLIKREGALEPSLVARIFLQAAQGVAAAHARGIIHRDLKPANLFLQQDEHGRIVAKVCDFGIAKVVTGDSDPQTQELTRTGGVIGSPLYMSPEQAKNAKNVDFHTDLWSLCASFWEALSGRRLWEGNTALGEIIVAICSEPIPDLAEAAPWVDLELCRIVQRGLERDPKLRWSSVAEMIEKLETLVGSQREVRLDELRGITHEARVSAPRLSTSSGVSGVFGDAPTVAASSNTMTGSSHETPSGHRPRRSGRRLAAGGLGLAVAAIATLIFLRGTPEKTQRLETAPDPRVAVATAPPREPPPRALPAKPQLELSVIPPEASLSVGGKALSVKNGRALLEGEPGETIEVVARSQQTEKSFRIFVTRDYTLEPSRIELGTPVTRANVATKAPKEPKQTARDSKSLVFTARPSAERPEPEPKPASKPASPTVKPKDDW